MNFLSTYVSNLFFVMTKLSQKFCYILEVHWFTKILAFIYVRGAHDKFPDFFRMGTFIDSNTHKPQVPFKVISSGCNALDVPFQQLLEGPMEVLLCERVNDFRHKPLLSPQLSHYDSLWA